MYKAEQGFITRGEESINNTPQSNVDEMQRLHDKAAKDLQMALATNPYVMPAYTSLMVMARTSSMPFSATDILKKAEASDDRTYFVRQEYMVSLQPRWGGSHEAMKEFAKSVIQYNDRNPRLWSLQGAADADRAYSHYQAGNFSAAVRYYTKALRFGDRFPWLEYRAASRFYLGKKDKAVNDYKKVLYYDPTETKSLAGAGGEEP